MGEKSFCATRYNLYLTNLLIVLFYGSLAYYLGLSHFFWMICVPIQLAFSIGIFLFYLQHNFEKCYYDSAPNWNFIDAGFDGSSYVKLPTWLCWFFGNINYHHLHHLSSRIPFYRLLACHALVSKRLPIHSLTISDIPSCLTIRLYDEKSKRMISFKAYYRDYGHVSSKQS